jgi:hypothetical protein
MNKIRISTNTLVFWALLFAFVRAGFAQTEHSAQAQVSAPQTSSVAAVSAEADPALPGSRLLRFSSIMPGDLTGVAGGPVTLRFALYAGKEGGDALWSELQQIDVARDGSYVALLGAGTPGGLPVSIFAGGNARWLGVALGESDQAEQPRLLLVGVPYALEATNAQTLGGLPASAFLRASDLQAATAQANPENSSAIDGTGKTGTVPLWTGSSALGNSVITQSGSKIGIGTASPATTLDVDGTSTLRGNVILHTPSAATKAAGVSSPLLQISASTFLTTGGGEPVGAVGQNFAWQAVPVNNNTASPSGNLNLLYGFHTTAPAPTGLSIAPNGQITFAPGQTFPGEGTISGVTAGTGLTGGGTKGEVTLNIDATKVPLLNGVNFFTGDQSINGSLALYGGTLSASQGNFKGEVNANASGGVGSTPYHALFGAGSKGAGGLLATSDTGIGALAISTKPAEGSSGVEGLAGSYNSGSFTTNAPYQVAGVWGDTSGNPNGGNAAGVIGTADNADGGSFFNNSKQVAAVYAENKGTSNAVYAQADGGGSGGTLVTLAPAEGSAGSFGLAGKTSSATRGSSAGTHVAGVWGDTSGNPNAGGVAAGVIGTADNAEGGTFLNNSALYAAVLGENSGSYAGIRGLSTGGGTGVDGVSTTNDGVKGTSTSGNGTSGISTSGNGVNGSSSGGNGVNGTSTGLGTGVNGSGFIGVAGSGSAVGVQGSTTAGTAGVSGNGPTIGVLGEATAANGKGVQGTARDFGVYGTATGGNNTVGVYGQGGYGMQAGGTQYGIWSQVQSGSSAIAGTRGIYGGPSAVGSKQYVEICYLDCGDDFSVSAQIGFQAGVWADTNNVDGDSSGYYVPALMATADASIAGVIVNNSNLVPALFIGNLGSGGGSTGAVVIARGRDGVCSFSGGGDTSCTGTLKTTVKATTAEGAGEVETYAVESTENWFEDAGSAQLVNGAAHVNLEPVFGQTVNTGIEYHVFLTPNDDCKGLYVTHKTASGFEVHELGGGRSSIPFEYRIMAKRLGHEKERLVHVVSPLRKRHTDDASAGLKAPE